MQNQQYTNDYFALVADGSERSAEVMAPMVLELIRPRSVVDVGCGVGTWASVFERLEVEKVRGIDGEYIDRSSLLIAPEHFIAADLKQPLSIEERFDLAVSLEVAEHLPASAATTIIKTLCSLSDVVLFSAAIPGQGGNHHINEQWPEYWAERFATRGYLAIDWLRDRVWNHPDVDYWYAQNILLYASPEAMKRLPRLKDLHQKHGGTPRCLVHPRLYDEHRQRSESLQRLEWTPGVRWCTRALATGLRRAGVHRLRSLSPLARGNGSNVGRDAGHDAGHRAGDRAGTLR